MYGYALHRSSLVVLSYQGCLPGQVVGRVAGLSLFVTHRSVVRQAAAVAEIGDTLGSSGLESLIGRELVVGVGRRLVTLLPFIID